MYTTRICIFARYDINAFRRRYKIFKMTELAQLIIFNKSQKIEIKYLRSRYSKINNH